MEVIIIILMVLITIAFIKSLTTNEEFKHTPLTLQNLKTIAKLVTNDGGSAGVVENTLHILYAQRVILSIEQTPKGLHITLGRNGNEDIPFTYKHKRIVKRLTKLLKRTRHEDALPIIIQAAAYAASLEKK
jgi:hypothetical protein